MYVYKEIELTKEQYDIVNAHRIVIDQMVNSGAAANINHVWLKDCADIHQKIFGGPTPNIKSNGLPIVSMFKNLLRKLKQHEERASTIREEAGSTSGTYEPTHGRGENRKQNHFVRRR